MRSFGPSMRRMNHAAKRLIEVHACVYPLWISIAIPGTSYLEEVLRKTRYESRAWRYVHIRCPAECQMKRTRSRFFDFTANLSWIFFSKSLKPMNSCLEYRCPRRDDIVEASGQDFVSSAIYLNESRQSSHSAYVTPTYDQSTSYVSNLLNYLEPRLN